MLRTWRSCSSASGGHNSTLYAPRRMGKTSLLKQTLAAARRQDMLGVLVDFSDVLSEPDVAARLDQAFRALPKRARRVIDRELGSIGVSTPLGGVVLGRRVQQPDAISIIHALLELPTKLVEQTEQRALVVFDEFQALIALKGLDGVFRSHLQHHAQVSYISQAPSPPYYKRSSRIAADRSMDRRGRSACNNSTSTKRTTSSSVAFWRRPRTQATRPLSTCGSAAATHND